MIGLFLGFGGISKGGVSCGSAFKPNDHKARVADLTKAIEADADGVSLGYRNLPNASDTRKDVTSNRKPIAWALTAPGGVLFLAGGLVFVAHAQTRREEAGAAKGAETPDAA